MTSQHRVDREYVLNWARHAHGSPLYQELCRVIADDPDLLGVMAAITNTPPPNLMFAAIHYLLAANSDHELVSFYPSLVEKPRPVVDVGAAFHDFVHGHNTEILTLANNRLTQTNECRRCTALLPLVMMADFSEFHLIDVGTSAGLNLNLDRYHYSWDGLEWGPPSPVELTAELRGAPPDLHPISVLSRTGIDLQPIDATSPSERRWLEALIWPEHHERRERLIAALDVLAAHPPRLVAGSVLDNLPQILDDLPLGEPVVVMNSFVMVQVEPSDRQRFYQIITRGRESRPIVRVSMELLDVSQEYATLEIDQGEGLKKVGHAVPHGDWVELS